MIASHQTDGESTGRRRRVHHPNQRCQTTISLLMLTAATSATIPSMIPATMLSKHNITHHSPEMSGNRAAHKRASASERRRREAGRNVDVAGTAVRRSFRQQESCAP